MKYEEIKEGLKRAKKGEKEHEKTEKMVAKKNASYTKALLKKK